MKKLIYPILSILFLSLGSCDKAKDLADVEFDAQLTTPEMTIAPSHSKKSGETGYDFSTTETINPLSNADIKEYLDKIQNWDINSVEIIVVSVSKAGTHLTAGTELEMKSDSNTSTLKFENDTPIEVGTTYDLPTEIYKGVESILNEKKEFTVSLTGGLNNDAIVVFKVNIDVTITANPLK